MIQEFDDDDEDESAVKTLGPSFSWKDLPLGRRHEHVNFAFFSWLDTTLLLLRRASIIGQLAVESIFALIWGSMILSIFPRGVGQVSRAPFLRIHVAVDVGRRVSSALNTAELALSTCFGLLLVVVKTSVHRPRILPALAILYLWAECMVVAPRLYTRAKLEIMTRVMSDLESWNARDRKAFEGLSDQVKYGTSPYPIPGCT